VVAEREDVATFATKLAIEALRGGDREALHAAGEGVLVVGLDEQVHVVVLDAGVHDAIVCAAGALRDRAADRAIRVTRAQVADLARDAKDDVHGVIRDVLGTRAMARIVPALARLGPGLLRDAPVAGAGAEVESALGRSPHWGNYN
jgi:hypothetical protein